MDLERSENKEPIDHDASEASKDDNDLEYSQITIQDKDDATTTKLHVLSFNVWRIVKSTTNHL